MELERLRRKIDSIDSDIIRLLNARAKLSVSIGRLKQKVKRGVYSPERESAVYERIEDENSGPLSGETLRAVYREIMSGSLALEKPIKVAYLGPPATFTHIAALKKFGSSVEYVSVSSITEVFTEVERGRADYGVVPIENSIEGAVNHTLDMFMESELKISSEISLEVSHNLLANCRMGRVKKVYSNPQVFGQCRMWLEANLPHAELAEVSSTTKAAETAARERDTAAIASDIAAKCYGLNILARSIEDSSHNVTRFLVIEKNDSPISAGPAGAQARRRGSRVRYRTSIMFSVKDRVGALHDMLVPFKRYKINLTKIESRPSKKKAWEYYFFVDMVGHCQDVNVRKALDHLERGCAHLKVLGSYPMA